MDKHAVTPLLVRIICSMVLLPLLLLAGCEKAPVPVQQTASTPAPAVQRANPASENCIAKGGKHSVERNPGGSEFGVCLFDDNRQCEEWALLHGECPAGGLRVTGYATPAARFCAISGGKYTLVSRSGAADEQGNCALPGGKTCDADEYFRGICARGKSDAKAALDAPIRFA